MSISNVPGLGVGAADADGASWIVPDSGRLVLVSGEQTTRVDPGSSVPAGGAGRVLLVAAVSYTHLDVYKRQEASTRGIRDNIAVDPHQDKRRWGLALHEAFRSGSMSSGERGRLGAESLRRVLGFVVGKDLLDARLERAAVREWRADRASVDRLHQSYLSLSLITI